MGDTAGTKLLELTVAKENAIGGVPIPNYFYWTLMDGHTYRLSWDVRNLTELGADQIVLSAMAADLSGNPFLKTANFSRGEVTVGELRADKPYNVHLEALRDGVSVWLYDGTIRTTLKEVTMTKAEETEGFPNSHHFNWSHVGHQTYQFSWDTRGLAGVHADGFNLYAISVESTRLLTLQTGDFSFGSTTLRIADPGKPYAILFEGLKGNDRVLYYVETIKTLSTEVEGTGDKESMENGEGLGDAASGEKEEITEEEGGGRLEDEESGGGGGSSPTTSGSGSAFLCSEFLFACVTLVLA